MIYFENKLDFTNLKDYLKVTYDVVANGEVVGSGMIDELDIPAKTGKAIKVNFTIPKEGISFLNLHYILNKDFSFAKKGHELGFDQLLIKEGRYQPELKEEKKDEKDYNKIPVQVTEDERRVVIAGSGFRYVYNKLTGLFDSLVKNQVSYLAKPMEFNIFRAPTDNDRNIKVQWQDAGYDRHTVRVYKTEVKKGEVVEITSVLAIAAIQREHILDIEVKWAIDKEGGIQVKLNGKRNTSMPFLPRFGFRMFMPKEFSKVEYFGYGPYESYIDKHRCTYLGKFKQKVSDMYEDYIRPQENSSHYGCQFLKVEDGDENYFAVTGKEDFSFNASEYTQEELMTKGHNYELEKSGFTVLCLDYKNSGVGSNSCGPELIKKYRLDEENISFDWKITLSR